MNDADDYQEEGVIPMRWSWVVPVAIGIGAIGNVIEVIATGTQDIARCVLSHVAWKENQKHFHQQAAMEIESLTGGTE